MPTNYLLTNTVGKPIWKIIRNLKKLIIFSMQNTLQNKKILITAYSTREYLDPVRFISNHSTRKMGYAIAETMYNLDTDVYFCGRNHILND